MCLFCSSSILGQALAHRGTGSSWTSTLSRQYLPALRLQVGPDLGQLPGEAEKERWLAGELLHHLNSFNFPILSIYIWLMLPVLQEVPGICSAGGDSSGTIADAWAWGRQACYLSWLEISHSISRLLAFAWYWCHFTGLQSDSNCHEIWSDKGSGTSWGSCSSLNWRVPDNVVINWS